PIRKTDCVLVDAGCDLHGYVSDITRCFPISGRFSAVQRTLYDVLNDIQSQLLHYVQTVRPLRLNECPHHVSHYLGMDVHDTPSIARNIECPPGVIITVEPGIYIRPENTAVRNEFRGIGFRIEDDVLLTETGAEILTANCIRDPEDIELVMDS
uniref:Peptidase M24 domain-containing protein n=1 Tax=Meloidogyne floridensis TaxID=298350 RepID=A0A915P3N1_9BILA